MTPTSSTTALPASPSVALTRTLAVGSLLGLIVLGLAWELFLAPIRPGGSWLALKVLPLCLPLAGLRAYSDRPPGNYLAMIEVALCLLLFTACALHVRLRLKNAALVQTDEGQNTLSPAPDVKPAG